jgi:hypothetical protein
MNNSPKNEGNAVVAEQMLTKTVDQVSEATIIDNVFGSYHIENGRFVWNKITHDGEPPNKLGPWGRMVHISALGHLQKVIL